MDTKTMWRKTFKNSQMREKALNTFNDIFNGWYRAYAFPDLIFKGFTAPAPKAFNTAVMFIVNRVNSLTNMSKRVVFNAVRELLVAYAMNEKSYNEMAYKVWGIKFPMAPLHSEPTLPADFNEALDSVKKICFSHHTALARGYVSRKTNGYFEYYDGKYGKGFKLHTPNWNSTTYHFVEYWIFKGKEAK